MAASPILTQGIGVFGSVNLMPTLGFTSVEVAVPTVAGIEFRAGDSRLHWSSGSNRLHWTAGDNRLHWTSEEQ